jgi:LysR family glycine cleavage system transcriptional activator
MPLIKINAVPDGWQRWFSEVEPQLASTEPELIGDSLLTGIQMARSAMGVILAPFPLVSPMVTSGALSVVKLWGSVDMGQRDFYFTYRKVDASSEKIKAVHKWLKVIAKNLEAESARLGI